MKAWFSTYISQNYLLTVISGSKFENYYLYFSIGLISLLITYRLFLFFRGNRPPIYKKFDVYWFWGYQALGISGIFIWFSRKESLPIFSTRIISYLWMMLIFGYTGFLIYYYIKKIPAKLVDFYEKKRKSKYLKH